VLVSGVLHELTRSELYRERERCDPSPADLHMSIRSRPEDAAGVGDEAIAEYRARGNIASRGYGDALWSLAN